MEARATGRTLTLDDYRQMWGRRKWIFLVSAFVIAAGTAIVAGLLPNQYRAEALILLEQPAVSDKVIKPGADADTQQQLARLVEETLSRTRMEQLIRDFGLYQEIGPVPSVVIAELRRQIEVQVIKELDPRRQSSPYALRVAFISNSPQQAQRVANELAAYFVSQKLKTQERGADETIAALQAQLQAAEQDLKAKERLFTEFKQHFQGQLPIHEQLNLQTLSRLQTQSQSNQQALERARQDAAVLQSLADAGSAQPAPANGTGQSLESRLQNLKAQLADYETRYTEEHPDIPKTRSEIARVEREMAQRDRISAAASADQKTGEEKLSPVSRNRLSATRAEIAAREREQRRLEQEIARYERNLQSIPGREQTYTEMQRAYDGAKGDYETIVAKIRDMQLSSDLERRQQGQRFRIQDFASLPDTPIWPVRWKINLAGLAGGALLGLLLAAGGEFQDSSFKSEQDLEYALGLKTLAVVPLLLTSRELRRQRQRRWTVGTASVVVCAATGALLYYVHVVRI